MANASSPPMRFESWVGIEPGDMFWVIVYSYKPNSVGVMCLHHYDDLVTVKSVNSYNETFEDTLGRTHSFDDTLGKVRD